MKDSGSTNQVGESSRQSGSKHTQRYQFGTNVDELQIGKERKEGRKQGRKEGRKEGKERQKVRRREEIAKGRKRKEERERERQLSHREERRERKWGTREGVKNVNT